jgi:hypothetical protein
VVASDVQFLSRGGREADRDGAPAPAAEDAIYEEDSQQPSSGKSAVSISDKELKPDDDIPF